MNFEGRPRLRRPLSREMDNNLENLVNCGDERTGTWSNLQTQKQGGVV